MFWWLSSPVMVSSIEDVSGESSLGVCQRERVGCGGRQSRDSNGSHNPAGAQCQHGHAHAPSSRSFTVVSCEIANDHYIAIHYECSSHLCWVSSVWQLYTDLDDVSLILVCRLPKDTQAGLLRSQNPAKKLIELGMEFRSMEQIIKDAVESLKSMGYI
ncbi:hypothetical protein BHE74_00035945 [Ensete ventricosum]|nr:hypothetical protein BHE74_00035945 [Ensete ventricosum]RZR83317.1 hypothetical protein BHM03_00009915 [Ensete ventricosum]